MNAEQVPQPVTGVDNTKMVLDKWLSASCFLDADNFNERGTSSSAGN